MTTIKINIFDYLDPRKYLHDWRIQLKEIDPGISHTYLCSRLGQKNRSYFNDIEKGRKRIGADVMDRLIELLGLKGKEARYFRALVGYHQHTSFEEKEYWLDQIVELNDTPKAIIDKETYAFYSEWYHTAIRAFLDTYDFGNDFSEVSRRFYGRISARQVRDSIALLSRLGLVAPNNGKILKPTKKIVSTGDVIKNELLTRYQLSNLGILREILEKDEPGTHVSSQMTVSVSKDGMLRIIERMKQFRSEIMAIVSQDEGKAQRVYGISLHTYPLTDGNNTGIPSKSPPES